MCKPVSFEWPPSPWANKEVGVADKQGTGSVRYNLDVITFSLLNAHPPSLPCIKGFQDVCPEAFAVVCTNESCASEGSDKMQYVA